jgi:hypothetical protein
MWGLHKGGKKPKFARIYNIKTMKNSFWLFAHHCVITDPHNTNLEYDQVEKRSKPE